MRVNFPGVPSARGARYMTGQALRVNCGSYLA